MLFIIMLVTSVSAAETSDAEADVQIPRSVPAGDGVAEEGVAEDDAQAKSPEVEPSRDAGVQSQAERDGGQLAEDAADRADAAEQAELGEEGPSVDAQVRELTEQLGDSATEVADSVAEHDESVELAKAEQAPAEAKTRRITRRTGRLDKLREAIDLDEIREKAADLLTAGSRERLVLSPHIDDPRWFEAMSLLKDDECDDALELADEVVGPPEVNEQGAPAVRYALARIQMCSSEQKEEGEETLREIAKEEDGVVAVLAKRRLGDSKAGTSGDEGLDLGDRLAAAKRRAKAGDVDEALRDLDTLHDELGRGWNKYRARSAQVDILEDAGRLDEAARKMLGIYRNTRDWNIGDKVEKRLERLQKRAGVELLTFGERVDRMRDLIARGRYSQARQISVDNAKRRGVKGDELDGWGLFRRALQTERQRDRKKAAELFERAEKLVEDDDLRPRIYFGWARALRRLDRDDEAIALYERLCREYARHHLCDDSLFEAGRLNQYLGRHDKARGKFELVVGLFPHSDKVPEALWRGAFSAYLMEDYEAAQGPLEHLIAYHGDLKDASELTMGLKAQYWLGTSKLKAGQHEAGLEELQKTISNGPLTWYGRLAAARIREAGGTPRVNLPRSTLAASEFETLSTLMVPRDDRLEVAAEYCRLGLWSDAIDELRRQTSTYPVPERAPQMLAAAYLADGQANWAHWIMKKHIDPTGPGYHNLHDWGMAFPVNYMELSHEFGEKSGVSPFLVQAIIRQESGFRPKVKSYAGAMGLMQLMPGTARYTQRQFTEDGGSLTHAQILDPETNVALGSKYIRIHTAFAADRIPLALAGYNAGPAPLESWFERYGDRELDAWVESITYREARGYVRKVFTSYITYAALYGDGELPDIALNMPEKLRKWGEVPEVDKVEEGEPVGFLR
ncbi:MAG: transglycosylase SLT domain-containing protein [Persicimonas sp.]